MLEHCSNTARSALQVLQVLNRRRSSQLAVLTGEEEVLASRLIPSRPEEFLRVFGEFEPEPTGVAFETSYGWGLVRRPAFRRRHLLSSETRENKGHAAPKAAQQLSVAPGAAWTSERDGIRRGPGDLARAPSMRFRVATYSP